MRFHIDNMTCSGCARSVTVAIRALDPTATVRADPPARVVEVESARPEAELRAALAAAVNVDCHGAGGLPRAGDGEMVC